MICSKQTCALVNLLVVQKVFALAKFLLKKMWNALDISSATVQVAPDLLKTLAILSDTTTRRSAVDHEDLKPYLK